LACSCECLESSRLLTLHRTNGKKVVTEGWATALILEGEQRIDVGLTSADDVGWHVEVKKQFYLMSEALKYWRRDIDNVTHDHPYGTEWDIFMVGQFKEVNIHNS